MLTSLAAWAQIRVSARVRMVGAIGLKSIWIIPNSCLSSDGKSRLIVELSKSEVADVVKVVPEDDFDKMNTNTVGDRTRAMKARR